MNSQQETREGLTGDRREMQGEGPYRSRQAAAQEPPPYSAPYPRRPVYPEESRGKSPVVAALMSLVPGLGQVYVGYYQQGFINILVVGSLIALVSRGVGQFEPLFIFFLVFYWLYNLVDAARRAGFYNQALAGLGIMELPKDLTMPPSRGSLAGGLLLIGLGLLLLSNTIFGYSLAWLEDWWPLALVGLGAYLTFRALAERKKDKGGKA